MKRLVLFLLVLFLTVFFASLIILAGGAWLAGQPNYLQIDRSGLFVYVEHDQALLATPRGPYRVGSALQPGCYRLDPPPAGETYGAAIRVWPECRGAEE